MKRKNLTAIGVEELIKEKLRVESVLAGIRMKKGVWTDSDRNAKRYAGAYHQAILTELSKRSREERARRSNSLSQRFIEVAREELDYEDFRYIMDEAMKRSELDNQNAA